MLSDFQDFADGVMARPNPFNFAAAIYYTEDNKPNLLFQIVITALSLLAIAWLSSSTVAVMTALAVIIGIALRSGCSSCAEIQGLGLIFLTIGIAIGKGGFLMGTGAALAYLVPFGTWYYMARRAYKNKPEPTEAPAYP